MRRTHLAVTANRVSLLVLLSLFMFPVLWLLATALKTRVDIYTSPPQLLFTPTLENFSVVFTDFDPLRLLLNSLIVAGGTVIVALGLGVPAGYGLARSRSKAAPLVSYGFLFLRMVPPVAALVPFYLLMRDVGLLGTQLSLIAINAVLNTGFVVYTMYTTFRAVPPDTESAAQMDGCGQWRVFWLIAVPLARGGIITSALFVFLLAWNDFLFALLLTRPETATLPVGMLATFGSVDISLGALGAFAQIATLPVIILAVLLNRYMVQGITKGTH